MANVLEQKDKKKISSLLIEKIKKHSLKYLSAACVLKFPHDDVRSVARQTLSGNGFWSSQDIITIPASPHAIFNSVLSQLVCSHSLKSRLHVCPRTRTWPRTWLRVRRELSSSSSHTHLIYGGWLRVLSELVRQCSSWRLSSWRHGDPTDSSVLRFTAKETVRSEPAEDRHKPGLIFWACELQRKQDHWAGGSTEERKRSLEILMKWPLKKNTWVT